MVDWSCCPSQKVMSNGPPVKVRAHRESSIIPLLCMDQPGCEVLPPEEF